MTPDELLAICNEHAIPVTITGLVREADAARLCGVSVRTLRDWRRCGDGPRCVRLGGWKYPVEDLATALTPPAPSTEIRQEPEFLDGDAPADSPHAEIVQKPARVA